MADSSRSSVSFREAAGDALILALDSEVEVVYAVDGELTLHFVNCAGREFALANDGDACRHDYGIGQSVKSAIPPVLRDFYQDAFDRLFAGGPPFNHLYKYSSATHQRTFCMRAARLVNGHYAIVSNQLVRQNECDVEDGATLESYVGPDGVVVQCAHCRRVRRTGTETWDWVPSYVSAPSEIISHGLCTSCFAQHYSS